MALLVRDPTGAEYANAEQELQERILNIYGAPENDDQLFRPDLADQHKVGFFGLDRASQTNVTEIVDLKEMTEVLQILLQDVATLKRDINFAKHVMQADYESKLQQKSLELYCRINERVTDLEKMHEERVGTVRRAFRQQLSDAIARVAVLYNKNLQRKVRQEKSKHEGDADKLEEKYKELQQTIQRNESIIHMLKMQIQQLQNKEPSLADSFDESVHSKTPSVNHEAEILKEELDEVNKKLSQLEESLQEKDDENSELKKEINKLSDQLTNEKMEKQQLQIKIETVKNEIDQDKSNTQKMIAKQKEEMERMMREKLAQAQQANSEATEAQLKARQQAEKEKMAYLYEQEKRLKEELAKERANLAEALKGDSDVNRLRKAEQMLREEVARLKREIERIHRTWEKKFAILQQSLHALKDESYIRQQLQRQAANLHHAAVSYAADTPMGIHPSSKHTSPTKRPLPDIPKYARPVNPNATPGAPQEKDYISYTVSAPSGRGTAIFSADENQIMSENDREDIPADVVPLPERPQRKSTAPGKKSADIDTARFKSGKGPVIIVPRVT
ncbi:uncharacterized protein C10orf67, mitochondrial-like isoform X6 [Mercenaria mercenaria]|uniref:uncharacterized protein C10orf67, mitochondrial-like isoform X6 n=1 Tax=Mercenaria mercenaria TaxID=6596 RepID=UPI00234F7909|nr:uncharacterized protein C10orf67, mitochondrial-like isoform X6 [Mercenaria mercenaria]